MLSASFRLILQVIFCLLGLCVVCVTQAQQNISAIQQEQPDERILWRLFHAHKITELKKQIDFLQQRYPAWKPPTVLLRFITNNPENQKEKNVEIIQKKNISVIVTH